METRSLPQLINLLLVEDNPADVRLAQEVFKSSHIKHVLNVVMDGEEAMLYLRKEGKYSTVETPDIIVLDLNLPKKDGKQVLKEIKTDIALKSIPVIILTTSANEGDIKSTYASHANCYLMKSINLSEYFRIVRLIQEFWLNTVLLPKK